MIAQPPMKEDNMKKINKIIAFVFILCMCINNLGLSAKAQEYSIVYNDITYTYSNMNILKSLIDNQILRAEISYRIIKSARDLGYSEQHPTIIQGKEEYEKAHSLRIEYKEIYDELNTRWQNKKEEYPVATYIWEYLKNMGYTNAVCAGILGNIMTEVGGNTLDIQFLAQTDSYYGICQWSKTYEDVWNTSLEVQCNYLENTIENEFNMFGFLYKENFSFEDFLNLENSSDVALAFAKCYERCHSSSYELRQKNAKIALEYFTS